MNEENVLAVLQHDPFRSIASTLEEAKKEAFISFGVPISVYGILLNDTSLHELKRGEFVMRKGDYGNSAYFVLEGALRRIVKPELDDTTLGRKKPTRTGFFASLFGRAKDLFAPKPPEYYRGDTQQGQAIDKGGTSVTEEELTLILDPSKYDTDAIGPGEIQGEIGAIYRTPRTNTIIVEQDSLLLEMRWQGLRDLMEMDPDLTNNIQKLYREHRLQRDLETSHLFSGLKESQLRHVQFKTYGKYDEWSADYLELSQKERAAVIETEEVIAQEGHYPNGIYIVQAGFARESQHIGHGHQTLNYLTTGHIFGLREILYNLRHRDNPIPFERSLRAIGYAHLLFVPTSIVEEVVIPRLTKEEQQHLLKGRDHQDPGQPASVEKTMDRERIGADLLEFFVENRFLIGTRTMLIDLDRCTRCDDCVRACAAAHDGNPRFLRNGPVHGQFMVANACMHCLDPVCMIGCPTGAIHRESFEGLVIINEHTCIGCATCYSNCPYDSIRMTAIRDSHGEFQIATAGEHVGSPIYKASKCDLCVEQPGGPSCERACPHDALKRMNMQDIDTLGSFVRK